MGRICTAWYWISPGGRSKGLMSYALLSYRRTYPVTVKKLTVRNVAAQSMGSSALSCVAVESYAKTRLS